MEASIGEQLKSEGVDAEYEPYRLEYEKPATKATYTPDFVLPNAIVVESKGRFVTADRQKHLMFRESHPDIDVRFVFQNPNQRLSKVSKTTYAAWCDKHRFKWARETIPAEWIAEPTNIDSYLALGEAIKPTQATTTKRRKKAVCKQ